MHTLFASCHLCILALALCIGAWASASVARAQTRTADLQVAASVDLRCAVATVPVNFGTYAPTTTHATVPLDSVGGVSVNCSQSGFITRVYLGQGLYPAAGSNAFIPQRQMGSGANRLTYNLFRDAARSNIWGGLLFGVNPAPTYPVTVPVYGRIPAGQSRPAGLYTDVVVATLLF